MPRKDIYDSRIDTIRQLKQARNKDRLVDFVASSSKQVNQRLYRLEKAGIGMGDSAYKFAQIETGKRVPRYTTSKNVLSKMTNEELYERALELNAKITSKTSTISGIKDITDLRLTKSIEQLETKIEDADINKEEFDKFLLSGGGEILNSKYYDSYQVIEDWLKWRKQGLTTKEIINEFKKQQDKANKYIAKGKDYDIDMAYINRKFTHIANKKIQKQLNSKRRYRKKR